MKIEGDNLKSILKKSVKGVIPDEIINRPKQGFAVPVEEWLLGSLGDYVKKEIKYFCDNSDLMKYSEVEKIMNGKYNYRIWPIFNVALWWKNNFANNHE
jgi:asparagine synthase (glutamine-hydrolysing)